MTQPLGATTGSAHRAGVGLLLERLAGLERRVREAVARHRAADPHPDDPFRGLYLSDEMIDALLAAPREAAPDVPVDSTPAPGGRLGELAASARLSPLDQELLLVALAPDVDSRFEQFYGYLNDDVTRRRATAGLALRLCGLAEAAVAGRARLAAGAPLARAGLLLVEDPERPLLSRTLRVPDRVVAHLLGDDQPEPAVAAVLAEDDLPGADGPELPGAAALARALEAGTGLAYLRERPGGSGLALASLVLGSIGRAALGVDANRLAAAADLEATVRALVREAVLRGAGVVIGPVEALAAGEAATVLDRLDQAPVAVVYYGTGGWDPRWSRRPPWQGEAAALPVGQRPALWRALLDGELATGVDPAAATAHFVLGLPQVRRAARAAVLAALGDGDKVQVRHLRHGARSQNAAGLEQLARRIEPAVGWADLVLPAAVSDQLRELAARARHRHLVLDQWRMRPGGGRGRGVAGLFAGDSGTGKTMAAEVIAADLGLDLYTVNLATVVDKYIGETEKNLERIFAEAAGVNGVLLFDEADAIFGKRSEVRDAHDRYANIESAYLLQRIETFDGLAVLATNLRANLDEAFTRRLDVVVDFPMPDEEQRLALWDRCLGSDLPRASDVDLAFLARAFELAGGNIRSASITAAYLAAEAGHPVTMSDVVGAVAREYRKLGRLCLEREFGRYLELV